MKTFNEATVSYLLKEGAFQPQSADMPGKKFPLDKYNRSFHEAWYWRTLPCGRKERRNWLSYSPKNDRMYCTHCILFAKDGQNAWTKTGCHAWNRASSSLIAHETSAEHITASVKALYREATLPLIPSLEKSLKEKVEQNRELVRQLIEVTIYLGRHCLAFRGHREGWKEKMMGNFKDLVMLLAKYSPAMSAYVAKLQSSKKKSWNYLSWSNQNRLIDAVATFIKNVIKKELYESKFFSISLDTTFDVSKKEQLSFIVRYVSPNGTVVERLISLNESSVTTGEALFKLFQEVCEELHLDWEKYLVGQSYDGAANMRGSYSGLQAKVKDKNPSAVYIWCYAHRLNLVVTDVVGCCINATHMFGVLETLFDFICSSKNRVKIYEDYQKERYPKKRLRRVKRVETTRWMSHSFALNVVLETYDAIFDTLSEVASSTGSQERSAVVQATSLLNNITSERFILTALIFKKNFSILQPLSAMLQSIDIDLIGATHYIDSVQTTLSNLRTEEEFQNILHEKDEFIEIHQREDYVFTPLPAARARRVKRQAGEQATDEVIDNPTKNFEIGTFLTIFDTILTQISERFNKEAQGIYKDLSLFTKRRLAEIKNDHKCFPKDAFSEFCKVYGKFVNMENLKSEYLQFVDIYPSFEAAQKLPENLHEEDANSEEENDKDNSESESEIFEIEDEESRKIKEPTNSCSLLTVFQICHNSGLKSIFVEIYTALHIAVTLFVSSATTERSFSKLKLVKNKLRSTMTENRLASLMIIACENDIQIDNDEVIEIFSKYSSFLSKELM